MRGIETDTGYTIDASPTFESGTYPADCCTPTVEQWLTWKPAESDRKIPRAPYAHPSQPNRYVSAQNPSMWTDFETAAEWATKLPSHELAFTIRDREAFPGEDRVLLDYDDVRDPDSGSVHPTVRDHIAWAGSYADVSPSGTGIHILCRGTLPDGVKTIADTLPGSDGFPDASIEAYDTSRFVAMTGRHLTSTPARTKPAQALLDRLGDEYATVVEGTPDSLLDGPETSREELAEIDTTADVQDVFDAIQQTVPDDIHLDSPVTDERADGSKSRDPVWANSESGTRLAEVDDGWIYREGMIGLDALQVVALEAGIISDEGTYPTGDDFWAAVETLRERGAHIPSYQPSTGIGSDGTATPSESTSGASTDRGTMAAGETSVSTGVRATADDVERTLETTLLRERVAEQQARIDELTAELDAREATIEAQRERIAALEADHHDHRQSTSVSKGWGRLIRWLRVR